MPFRINIEIKATFDKCPQDQYSYQKSSWTWDGRIEREYCDIISISFDTVTTVAKLDKRFQRQPRQRRQPCQPYQALFW